MRRIFLSTVRTDILSPFHRERINIIDRTDLTSVRRKVAVDLARRGVVANPTYLDEGILALQQYYAIAVLDPNNMHAVSDSVDPFWHAHILHTAEYIRFCEELAGGYLHHNPLDHDRERDVVVVDRLYRYTMECFGKFFSYVNPDFFPKELPRHRLICVHHKVSYSAELMKQAALPANPAMQDSVYFQ